MFSAFGTVSSHSLFSPFFSDLTAGLSVTEEPFFSSFVLHPSFVLSLHCPLLGFFFFHLTARSLRYFFLDVRRPAAAMAPSFSPSPGSVESLSSTFHFHSSREEEAG